MERRGEHTRLTHSRRRGPLAVQRPFYPEGGVCHLYLLHPPGGLVGGDSLEIEVQVREGAQALLTTPGAAKLYRSADRQAIQRQRFRVGDGGILEWFPQESILFSGARVQSRTHVELRGSGRFLGWEIQSLGRPAVKERFESGAADLGLDIGREAKPLLSERLRVPSVASLDGPSSLRGYPITALFIASGAGAEDLAAARQGLAPTNEVLLALTLLEDLLVARCLARSLEPVRRTFLLLWGILRPRLLGREACPPRIWAT